MADMHAAGDARWSHRIRQSAQVVSSRLGDAGVLVHLKTNRIYEVNATGLRIWELAGEGRTLGEIETTLQREFDIDRERLRRELLALVTELTREGLLQEGPMDDDRAE
ncbi:MAG: PqqD family protein [Acidobacteria bacterium]|nr:PqqD family protein [Acidobacteriota bacterium]